MPTTFLDPLLTGSTKSTMKKKSGRQFTGREAAEQEEAVKRRTKQKYNGPNHNGHDGHKEYDGYDGCHNGFNYYDGYDGSPQPRRLQRP